jgi:predicted Zn-dependent peptidase
MTNSSSSSTPITTDVVAEEGSISSAGLAIESTVATEPTTATSNAPESVETVVAVPEPLPLPKAPAFLKQVETITLDSGATLYYNHVSGAPRLALRLYIPGGNSIDRIPGMTDIIDRLIFKGTHQFSAEEIAFKMDDLCLDADISTGRDTSVLSASLLPEDLAGSLQLLSEVLFYSTLDELPKEIEKIRGELQLSLDTPKAKAADKLQRELYAALPYGVTSTVLEENLDRMTRVDALFLPYQQAYRPNRFVVSVAGDVPRDALVKLLNKAFDVPRPKGSGTTSDVDRLIKAHALKESKTFTIEANDAAQAHIYQAWLTPAAKHKDIPALSVLNTLLGAGGLSARLFLELRDKQGLAYTVRSSLESFKHLGNFTLYIGTAPQNVPKCLEGFKAEIQKLMDVLVEPTELEEAKRNLIGRRSVFLETVGAQAGYVGSSMVQGFSLKELEGLSDKIAAVTPADIQRVAKLYFSKPSYTVVVGPASCLPR